jgi:hypothetical protein
MLARGYSLAKVNGTLKRYISDCNFRNVPEYYPHHRKIVELFYPEFLAYIDAIHLLQ